MFIPAVRGILLYRSEYHQEQRLIPAGAGNTIQIIPLRPGQAVYPRWRGEHLMAKAEGFTSRGLSPLARGTHKNVVAVLIAGRFIPAGAGNTLCDRALNALTSVYPRWRGEHARQRIAELEASRFIPAGAGNTRLRRRWLGFLPVYPRWRGEHGFVQAHCELLDGLSPLARGTLIEQLAIINPDRFIPAGAGNT